MGLIDDLIRIVQEAMDDARERTQERSGQPQTPPSTQRSPPPAAVFERTLTPAELRQRAQAQQLPRAARPATTVKSKVPDQQVPLAPARRSEPASAPAIVLVPALRSARFKALLHQPSTLREVLVLRELLGPPLALRRRFPHH